MYKDKNGKAHDIKVIYLKRQLEMEKNGWMPRIPHNIWETAQDFYNRLSESYPQVKLYYGTTTVRGYYKLIGYVKYSKDYYRKQNRFSIN